MEDLEKIVQSFLSLPDAREDIIDWQRIIRQYNHINDTQYTINDVLQVLQGYN